MALHTIDPDPALVAAINAALSKLLELPEVRRRRLGRIGVPAALTLPHNVYSLGLDRLADSAPEQALESVEPVAQRFLLVDAAGVVASVEIAAADGTGLSFTEGPYDAQTARLISAAEVSLDLGDAEVRALRVPALHLMALWLHALDGQRDVLVPMSPAPLPVEPGRFYPAEELLAILSELAAERRDAPPDSGG
jgi:hypothetical protein